MSADKGMSVPHGTKRAFGKNQKPADYIDAEDRPGLAARQCATRLLGAVIEKHTSLDGLTDNTRRPSAIYGARRS